MHLSWTIPFVICLYPVDCIVVVKSILVVLSTRKHDHILVRIGVFERLGNFSSVALIYDQMHFTGLTERQIWFQFVYSVLFLLFRLRKQKKDVKNALYRLKDSVSLGGNSATHIFDHRPSTRELYQRHSVGGCQTVEVVGKNRDQFLGCHNQHLPVLRTTLQNHFLKLGVLFLFCFAFVFFLFCQ